VNAAVLIVAHDRIGLDDDIEAKVFDQNQNLFEFVQKSINQMEFIIK